MAKKADDKKLPRNVLRASVLSPQEHPDDALARILTRPEIQAAAVIQQLEGENHEVNAVARELTAQVAAVHAGDLRRAEAMLVSQAHTLDEVFCNLLRRGAKNLDAGYPDAGERYMRLAFKAQAQCRATLDSLGELKNPRPVAFVRQANIAHGAQQVLNGVPAAVRAPAHAGESAIQSNELLGHDDGERLDTRTAGTAGGANSELAAVGVLNGSEN